MTGAFVLEVSVLTYILLSVWFLILVVERCLIVVNRFRQIAQQGAMGCIQIWTSGHMAGLDIEHEQGKLERAQEYAQLRLHPQRWQLQVEEVEQQ